MKLIGFTFMLSQEDFEEWQLKYPDYSVHTVQPHLQTMVIQSEENRDGSQGADMEWGIFVTYSYKRPA